jgi:hypothetical protein
MIWPLFPVFKGKMKMGIQTIWTIPSPGQSYCTGKRNFLLVPQKPCLLILNDKSFLLIELDWFKATWPWQLVENLYRFTISFQKYLFWFVHVKQRVESKNEQNSDFYIFLNKKYDNISLVLTTSLLFELIPNILSLAQIQLVILNFLGLILQLQNFIIRANLVKIHIF